MAEIVNSYVKFGYGSTPQTTAGYLSFDTSAQAIYLGDGNDAKLVTSNVKDVSITADDISTIITIYYIDGTNKSIDLSDINTIDDLNTVVGQHTSSITNLDTSIKTLDTSVKILETNIGKAQVSIEDGDKILSLVDGKLSSTLSIEYDNTEHYIYLYGKSNDDASKIEISKIDAAEFIKDGMIKNVEFDPTTNKLTLTFNTDGGDDSIDVDLSELVETYTAGNGLSLSATGEFSVDTGVIATKASVDDASARIKVIEDASAAWITTNYPDNITVNGIEQDSSQNIQLTGLNILVGGDSSYKDSSISTVIKTLGEQIASATQGGITSVDPSTNSEIYLSTNKVNSGIYITIKTKKVSDATQESTGLADAYDVKQYVDSGIETAKTNIIGETTDGADANTINGAKTYANSLQIKWESLDN